MGLTDVRKAIPHTIARFAVVQIAIIWPKTVPMESFSIMEPNTNTHLVLAKAGSFQAKKDALGQEFTSHQTSKSQKTLQREEVEELLDQLLNAGLMKIMTMLKIVCMSRGSTPTNSRNMWSNPISLIGSR